MRTITLSMLLQLAFAATGSAQDQGEWIKVNGLECQYYFWQAGTGVEIQWDGGCENNRITGPGTLKIFASGEVYITYKGETSNGKENGQGEVVFNSGTIYTGQFKDGNLVGNATVYFANGDKYVGQVKNWQMEGTGTYITEEAEYTGTLKSNEFYGPITIKYSNGTKFEGAMNKGSIDGPGKYTFQEGTILSGVFKNQEPQGQMTVLYTDGSKYVGEMNGFLRNGNGTLTWPDGSKYVGQWVGDKKHGQGALTWKDGSKYTGGWKEDSYHGFGTLTQSNGGKFTGEWREGMKYNGQIVEYDGNGKLVFQGEIKDYKRIVNTVEQISVKMFDCDAIFEGPALTASGQKAMAGKGKLTFTSGKFNGAVYEGEIIGSRMQGEVTITTKEGNVIKGNMDRHGGHYFTNSTSGTINYRDGSIYTGDIQYLQAHGAGVMKYSNGAVFDGEFDYDQPSKGTFTFRGGQKLSGNVRFFDDGTVFIGQYFGDSYSQRDRIPYNGTIMYPDGSSRLMIDGKVQ